MAEKHLLLGDEALALGALHAGLSGVYAYPGTPSTEITEFIQNHPLTRERNLHCDWSSNEKTAMEAALGVSYAGKRALVCMKHVGMNVCADAFVNSAMTGANGGLVVTACDDPSMHSSQNEQDSRFYAEFAMMPCFEPSSQQETYAMIRHAFDFSEEKRIPVLMRLTTRMAHSRAVVETGEIRPENEVHFPENPRQWVLLPANAKVRNQALIADYAGFGEAAEQSPFNVLSDGPDDSLGIIACGIAYNYLMENFPDGCPYPVLKVSQYPFPKGLARRLAARCKTLLVLEEGQPLVEKMLCGVFDTGITVKGVKVGPSPEWLQKKLMSIGHNPINNVVDISNFILFEIGQPLHTFDASKIVGGKVIVRRAFKDEPIRTLDGIDRKLCDRDMVIANAEGPMCIAGVFGGEDSGVTEATTDVFIESAYFDPGSIRKTAKSQTLQTDASFRYERGADPEAVPFALRRAALLIQELAGGEIVGCYILGEILVSVLLKYGKRIVRSGDE